MQVLLVSGPLAGTLPAPRVIEIMAAAWRSRSADDVAGVALSDGDAGILDAVAGLRRARQLPVEVPGPLGEPVAASLVHVPGDVAGGPTRTDPAGTVYAQVSQVIGDSTGTDRERVWRRGTSVGVGRLLAVALDVGAGRVVVGLGPTPVLDGGTGLLHGLGLRATGLAAGGAGLGELTVADLDGLADLRDRLATRDVVVACAEDPPLLGRHGAAAAGAARSGVDAVAAQVADRRLGHLADLVERCLAEVPDARRSLPLARAVDGTGSLGDRAAPLARRPRSGAGGGVGFALAALGARLVDGAALVADVVDLAAAVARADLVVHAGDRLDADAVHGGTLPVVGAAALAAGVPVVAIAGTVEASRRELARVGVVGAYPTRPVPGPFARPDATPGSTADLLAVATARVAATYSPRR